MNYIKNVERNLIIKCESEKNLRRKEGRKNRLKEIMRERGKVRKEEIKKKR